MKIASFIVALVWVLSAEIVSAQPDHGERGHDHEQHLRQPNGEHPIRGGDQVPQVAGELGVEAEGAEEGRRDRREDRHERREERRDRREAGRVDGPPPIQAQGFTEEGHPEGRPRGHRPPPPRRGHPGESDEGQPQ